MNYQAEKLNHGTWNHSSVIPMFHDHISEVISPYLSRIAIASMLKSIRTAKNASKITRLQSGISSESVNHIAENKIMDHHIPIIRGTLNIIIAKEDAG